MPTYIHDFKYILKAKDELLRLNYKKKFPYLFDYTDILQYRKKNSKINNLTWAVYVDETKVFS